MSTRTEVIPRLVPPFVLVLSGLLLFPSAGHDDTHITCWPAYTLSHFGQILNYNGERVEQSSSLLQVVLLAVFGKLTGADVVTLAKLSSIVFGVASLLVLFTLVARVTSRAGAFVAAMVAAASTPIAYWSFSGMESSIVSFTGLWLVLTAADYLARHPAGSMLKSTVAIAAFALVRPETPLLLACFLGSALAIAAIGGRRVDPSGAIRTEIVQRAVWLFVIGAVVCSVLFAFRLIYFGALFPQPVTAKFSNVSLQTALQGLHYVKRNAWNDGAPTAVTTVMIVTGVFFTAVRQLFARMLNWHVVLSLLLAIGYLCCVVLSAGDWMEGGRFLVHFLPAAVACIPFALDGVTNRWALPAVTALLLTMEVSSEITFAKQLSTSTPLWGQPAAGNAEAAGRYSWFERRNRINVRDLRLIHHLDDVITQISNRKQTPVVVLSGQMGMVAYHIARRHFGRVRFFDRHGLIERTLTDCVLTRDGPRHTGGLALTYDRYFENLVVLQETCGQVRPDIVFDIGLFSKSRLDRYGYRAVYTQTGEVTAIGTRLAGVQVLLDAFVAVDGDALSLLDRTPEAAAR